MGVLHELLLSVALRRRVNDELSLAPRSLSLSFFEI